MASAEDERVTGKGRHSEGGRVEEVYGSSDEQSWCELTEGLSQTGTVRQPIKKGREGSMVAVVIVRWRTECTEGTGQFELP